MPIFRPRIAIVGGGPSGLALGKLLLQRGISPTIYELREKPTPTELAKPSGMLDLHDESGLKVMRESGLWEGFQASVGDCSESCRVLDPQGNILHTDEGEISTRPEIARNALGDLLLQSISPDIIKWSSKIKAVSSARNAKSGATEIMIDHGIKGTTTHDFVVGADGAWSRVRKLLTDAQPFYSGVQWMTATVRQVSTKYPHLLRLNGTGTLNALGGGNGIMTHRGPQDSIRVYAAISTPEADWANKNGFEGKTAAVVKDTLLSDGKLFQNWAPELQDLLATACNEETKDSYGGKADIMPMYMLPVGHRWDHQKGVTLIGDAAHLMTPWSGEGVNLALWDSLDLANVLAAGPETTDAAAWQFALEPRLREFEETMAARAQIKATEAVENKDSFMSENGGQVMANFFKAAIEGASATGNHVQAQ